MNDVRDEQLGMLLDRAAGRISLRPQERLPEVIRTGSRRRAVRLTAIGAALAVFVGTVSWAGLSLRAGKNLAGGTRTFSSSSAPWTFEYPSGWTTETTSHAGPELVVNVLRTSIVNGPMPSDHAIDGPNSGGNEATTGALGDAGAVVLVERLWHEPVSVPRDDDGARRPGSFVKDAQSPGWIFRERARCDGTLCFHVVEWLGPSVSDADRGAAAQLADSVRLADIDRWTESDGVHATLHDEQRWYVVTYPTDWIVAEENLTPDLAEPGEILSLGTFPLRAGRDIDDGLRLFDAPVAPKALEDMTSQDAFVSVQESNARVSLFDPRPERFGPLGCGGSIFGCNGDDWSGVPFRAWWIPFADGDRAFYLFVAIGNDASPELTQQAWEVADSLSFGPAGS